MWKPKITLNNHPLLYIWLGSLILYPFIIKLINENISKDYAIWVGVTYGVINIFLYVYSFWNWFVSYKESIVDIKHTLWFFLLIINGLMILAFIASLIMRIVKDV